MILEKIKALLADYTDVDVESITLDTAFADLGIDSLRLRIQRRRLHGARMGVCHHERDALDLRRDEKSHESAAAAHVEKTESTGLFAGLRLQR